MRSNVSEYESEKKRTDAVADLIVKVLKNESVMKHCGYNYDELSENEKTAIINDMLIAVKRIGDNRSFNELKVEETYIRRKGENNA